MNNSTCQACGAPIKWIVTKKGKKMPVDLKARRFYVITNGMPVQMQGHEPHFATCPYADRFRKKKKAPEKPVVKDLGWANGWQKTPTIVLECRKAGHKVSDKSDAPGVPYACYSSTVRCDICGYVYHVDSS